MIEELQLELSRLQIRYQAAQAMELTEDTRILWDAAEEMNELVNSIRAGYPPMDSAWLILLWQIHPYEPGMSS